VCVRRPPGNWRQCGHRAACADRTTITKIRKTRYEYSGQVIFRLPQDGLTRPSLRGGEQPHHTSLADDDDQIQAARRRAGPGQQTGISEDRVIEGGITCVALRPSGPWPRGRTLCASGAGRIVPRHPRSKAVPTGRTGHRHDGVGVVEGGRLDLRSCQGWTSRRWHASAKPREKLLRSQHWGRVNGGDCSFFVGLVTAAGRCYSSW
jgi:hypothetical protein